MIVYVESNFLLELARQQEQAASAEEILRLAEHGGVDLAFPTFAACEPFSTLTYYSAQRNRFVNQELLPQLRDLSRLEPQRGHVPLLQQLQHTLLTLGRSEMERLEATVARLMRAGRSIPLTAPVFEEARFSRSSLGLSVQDAIVYALVLTDLRRRPKKTPKCFLSTNLNDFGDPAIKGELARFHCEFKAKFDAGLAYIWSRTGLTRRRGPQAARGGRGRRGK